MVLLSLMVIFNVFPLLQDSKGLLGTIFLWLTQITRVAVGGLFIFSGFIKANDPLGFSYKLEEYFEVFKQDSGLNFFEWFAHISLPLAVLLCVSEMILGFMLLLGYKRNLTLWLLFAQIAFFTFLTFYSACYNKVTTCGCFGDFLVLKPWTSFWKDVALMMAITVLFSGKEHINDLFTPMIGGVLFGLGLVASFIFPIYAYRNLPPYDFRAYAIGMDIKENMKTPSDYQPPVFETHFKYENLKTHEVKDFDMKNYPWQDTLNWKWVSTDNVMVKDAVHPPKIVDFSVNDLDGNSITDSLLNYQGYQFWLICYDINKTEDDETLHSKMNDFYKLSSGDKIPFIALTASDAKSIDQYKHGHQALYDFANADGIVLKTMIRSNPGLILLKGSKVIMNWHHHNFPSYSEVKDKYMK